MHYSYALEFLGSGRNIQVSKKYALESGNPGLDSTLQYFQKCHTL